jgi:NADPH-dependent 2,4-dienoyl-CoA reductase/sulfur reductase-like enzyme
VARRIVIVGAGQAGRRCAEALRELDAAAEILLLGEEAHLPYDRPPLSKAVLLGQDPGRGLFVRGPEFYAERRIALRTGTRVEALDLPAKAVATAAGERIGWDSLVLATGARARPLPVPGAEDPRVRLLHTLEDAEAIRAALLARPRLAVVGGGLIGLEVAASARQLGCPVAVLEAADRLMARCVPPAISGMAAALHRERGVALHLSCAVRRIEPHGAALLLDAGAVRVEADLVVVGIGGIANAALAEAAGLAVRDGILADACGRTSHPDVYAAGEVARFAHPFFGGRAVRLEAWQVAQNQPAAVARAICGGAPQPYDEVPWHWTDQFDRNLQVFGTPEPEHELVRRPAPDGRLTAIAVDAGRRARGAVLINNGREATPVRRLIAAGRPLDLAALRDPAVPLRQFL